MKRLVVLFVFLVVVGGVVFFFGWIQIRLDADEHAVIFTKTHGWEEQVVRPGEFTWRWQRLLPTNLTLHVFPLTTRVTSATMRGTLPSAAAYGSLVDGTAAFSYLITLDVAYRLREDSLPQLARDHGLRSNSLDEHYSSLDAQIGQSTKDSIVGLVTSRSGSIESPVPHDVITGRVVDDLTRHFPDLELLSVDVIRVELPDLDLYQQARTLYEEVLETRAQSLKDAAQTFARQQTQTDNELRLLERYGEILDRFPILLDYFRLSVETGGDPLSLESLIRQTGQ